MRAGKHAGGQDRVEVVVVVIVRRSSAAAIGASGSFRYVGHDGEA